jgi:hypothetical protein
MALHSFDAKLQNRCNLLVAVTLGHQLDDLALAKWQ